MGHRRLVVKAFVFLVWALLFLPNYTASAGGAGGIPPGTTFPDFTLEGPASAEDQAYLGLKSSKPFTLSQLPSKMVLIDIINVT